MARNLLIVAAFLTCFVASPGKAAGCDQPKTGFDSVYCFAKVYMELDTQLTQNYQSLMRSIPPTEREILRGGQRQWIKQRDNACYAGFDRSETVNIACALSTTRDRVQFLSDRSAECKASGCNDGRLAMYDVRR